MLFRSVYGVALTAARRFDDALAEGQRAFAANPNDLEVMTLVAGSILTRLGQHERAIDVMRRVFELDPFPGAPLVSAFARTLYMAKRHEEAVAGAKRCIELVPQSAHCLATLGAALGQLNRTAEALIAVGSLMRAAPDFSLAGEVAQLRQTYRRDDDVAHFADGLRKAGVSE